MSNESIAALEAAGEEAAFHGEAILSSLAPKVRAFFAKPTCPDCGGGEYRPIPDNWSKSQAADYTTKICPTCHGKPLPSHAERVLAELKNPTRTGVCEVCNLKAVVGLAKLTAEYAVAIGLLKDALRCIQRFITGSQLSDPELGPQEEINLEAKIRDFLGTNQHDAIIKENWNYDTWGDLFAWSLKQKARAKAAEAERDKKHELLQRAAQKIIKFGRDIVVLMEARDALKAENERLRGLVPEAFCQGWKALMRWPHEIKPDHDSMMDALRSSLAYEGLKQSQAAKELDNAT